MPAAAQCKGLTLPEVFQAIIWHLMQFSTDLLVEKETLPLKAIKKKPEERNTPFIIRPYLGFHTAQESQLLFLLFKLPPFSFLL